MILFQQFWTKVLDIFLNAPKTSDTESAVITALGTNIYDGLRKPAPPATPAPLPRGWSRSYAWRGDKQTRTYGLRRTAVSRVLPARQ